MWCALVTGGQPGALPISGGYPRAALAAGAGHVWAFDREPNAIAEGRALEDGSDGRLTLIHDRFSNMVSALGARGVAEVDAVTFDIGVSSMQLDRAERGFSFQSDAPLDMRMEVEGTSAAAVLNTADESLSDDVLFKSDARPSGQ